MIELNRRKKEYVKRRRRINYKTHQYSISLGVEFNSCTEMQRTSRSTAQGRAKEAHRTETSWSTQVHGGYTQSHPKQTHGYIGILAQNVIRRERHTRASTVAREYDENRDHAIPRKCLPEHI